MDENLTFRKILAQSSDGIGNKMILMPYAKDLVYTNGHLKLTLDLFNDLSETEISIDIVVSEELQGLLDNLMEDKVV
jgi:hypothetical protein